MKRREYVYVTAFEKNPKIGTPHRKITNCCVAGEKDDHLGTDQGLDDERSEHEFSNSDIVKKDTWKRMGLGISRCFETAIFLLQSLRIGRRSPRTLDRNHRPFSQGSSCDHSSQNAWTHKLPGHS